MMFQAGTAYLFFLQLIFSTRAEFISRNGQGSGNLPAESNMLRKCTGANKLANTIGGMNAGNRMG